MRYPNLRYGNPQEFAYYAQGIPIKDLAKRLRRSERCVTNWLTGRYKMPYWAPELLRLQHMEHQEMLRQMGIYRKPLRLGNVTPNGIVYQMPARQNQPPSACEATANAEAFQSQRLS